jgi:hypothetical protein
MLKFIFPFLLVWLPYMVIGQRLSVDFPDKIPIGSIQVDTLFGVIQYYDINGEVDIKTTPERKTGYAFRLEVYQYISEFPGRVGGSKHELTAPVLADCISSGKKEDCIVDPVYWKELQRWPGKPRIIYEEE